jgi:hypothetical protein
MADIVFNVSKGKVAELCQRVENNLPAGCLIRIKLYKAFTEADAVDCDTETNVAAQATIADFTNYVSKTVNAAALTPPAADDTGNKMVATLPDQTWTAAGGASNNTLAKLVVYFDSDGSDTAATNIPMTGHDFVFSTNGSDMVADFHATNGFFQAA